MTEHAELLIDCRCELGEGPIWHPERNELFWFDINVGRLHRADGTGKMLQTYQFGEPAAAAAVIDRETLLVASASALLKLDIGAGTWSEHMPLEADKPGNRSNDSRVTPSGTFWIGTMSRKGDQEPGSGAVYAYRAGKLETLFDGISIPNGICFSPDGTVVYFTDTPTKKILKRPIDPETGLPTGPFELFADTSSLPGAPDGSVVDSEGFMWNARWGGRCVIRFAPDGSVDQTVDVPADNVTCPCFGGEDLRTLFITSAAGKPTPEEAAAAPHAGSIFAIRTDVAGSREPVLAF